MRKVILNATALAILLLGVTATPVAADTRCAGRPGIQLWEHAGKQGASIRFCWGRGYTNLVVANLGHYTTNLNWGANWNDRTSSAETFNMTGHTIRLYADANLVSTSVGGRVIDMAGNTYIPRLGDYWDSSLPSGFNDRLTSFKSIK